MDRAKALPFVLVAAIAVVLAPGNLFATTFTALNDPLAGSVFGGTAAFGISGNNIVGYYGDPTQNYHGFLYNGSTYTILNDPLAVNETYAQGVCGNNVVGFYLDASGTKHGFFYNGSTYTTLDDPSAGVYPSGGTTADGISGNYIVGNYGNASSFGGLLYNILTSSYSSLDDPLGADGTFAKGICGNNIVGSYEDATGKSHGFLYNMLTSTYTTLDDPLGLNGTFVNAISGNNIVGFYEDASGIHDFLYNGSTYMRLDDDPQAPSGGPFGGTLIQGISGDNIVGYYNDNAPDADVHAFIETIPEPSSVVLFGFAVIGFAVIARAKKTARRSQNARIASCFGFAPR